MRGIVWSCATLSDFKIIRAFAAYSFQRMICAPFFLLSIKINSIMTPTPLRVIAQPHCVIQPKFQFNPAYVKKTVLLLKT